MAFNLSFRAATLLCSAILIISAVAIFSGTIAVYDNNITQLQDSCDTTLHQALDSSEKSNIESFEFSTNEIESLIPKLMQQQLLVGSVLAILDQMYVATRQSIVFINSFKLNMRDFWDAARLMEILFNQMYTNQGITRNIIPMVLDEQDKAQYYFVLYTHTDPKLYTKTGVRVKPSAGSSGTYFSRNEYPLDIKGKIQWPAETLAACQPPCYAPLPAALPCMQNKTQWACNDTSRDVSTLSWVLGSKTHEVGDVWWDSIYTVADVNDVILPMTIKHVDTYGNKYIMARTSALNQLSDFVKELIDVQSERLCLMETNFAIIGCSHGPPQTVDKKRISMFNASDDLIAYAARVTNVSLAGQLASVNHTTLSLKYNNTDYFIQLDSITHLNLKWVSLYVSPAHKWIGPLRAAQAQQLNSIKALNAALNDDADRERSRIAKTVRTGQIVSVILLISVLSLATIGFLVVVNVFIGKPLERTSRCLDKISMLSFRDLDLTTSDTSRIQEIQNIQESFSRMVMSLKSFAKYISVDLIKELAERKEIARLGMSPQHVTVLFQDIAGFTAMCEKVEFEVLIPLLERYFSHMSEIIMQSKGFIDKYIGDCIMAMWGAPVTVTEPELRACMACLAMQRHILSTSEVWQRYGLSLDVRTGIACGMALVGNMGSNSRMNFTCIGDCVNVAARLEPVNKLFGSHVLIDENLNNAVSHKFLTRFLGKLQLSGRQEYVNTYELVSSLVSSPSIKDILSDGYTTAMLENGSEVKSPYTVPMTPVTPTTGMSNDFETGILLRSELHQLRSQSKAAYLHFNSGVSLFTQGLFQQALEAFQRHTEVMPEDPATEMMLKRVQHLIDHPPQGWNGIINAETK